MPINHSSKPDTPPPSAQIYSVTRLVGEIRTLLEASYREIWVEGEISGLAQPASGHRYFSLKESESVIRCTLFKNHSQWSASPGDGMQALVRGRVSVYEPRGDMQLIVSYLEDAGEGALRREFEQLKQKLAAEGLFDSQHKQPLPTYPAVIGIISSDSGAALHDIRVTLKRRYPVARLIVYPTAVQGANAVPGILHMLALANQRQEADVLILTRGGGSKEDLQSFNDERVARAIFASQLPVISAVGHEIDFTISDLVADLRAPTPTAAAETVAPELAQLRTTIRHATDALRNLTQRFMDTHAQKLDYTSARLVHPRRRIQTAQQSQQTLTNALKFLVQGRLDRQQLRLQQQIAELRYCSPAAQLAQNLRSLAVIRKQLINTTTAGLDNATQTIGQITNKLNLMSPTHTLARGYAIIQGANQEVITDAGKTNQGQRLTARVARGKFLCVVERVLEE